MSKILFIIILGLCSLSFAKQPAAARQPASAAVDPLAPLPDPLAPLPENAEAPAAVVPSDFDLANVNRPDATDPLNIQAAVERYLAENPDCEDQPERICEVKILKDKKEKCGKGFKLADSSGWQLNATKFKARQYEKGMAQSGARPPTQKGHSVYGFGVCHKF